MPEHYEELEVGFSTADVGDVSVQFSRRTLTVGFADYRGTKTSVVFKDVAGYKWDDSLFERISVAPDRAYRVCESDWLRCWPTEKGYSHYALGFCGTPGFSFLEVIAKTIEQTHG